MFFKKCQLLKNNRLYDEKMHFFVFLPIFQFFQLKNWTNFFFFKKCQFFKKKRFYDDQNTILRAP